GGKQRQRLGAGLCRAHQLVGVEGGRGDVCRQGRGFGRIGSRLHAERLARQRQPERAVVGQDGQRRLVFLHGQAMVAGERRTLGRGLERRQPFGRLVIG